MQREHYLVLDLVLAACGSDAAAARILDRLISAHHVNGTGGKEARHVV